MKNYSIFIFLNMRVVIRDNLLTVQEEFFRFRELPSRASKKNATTQYSCFPGLANTQTQKVISDI